MMKHSFSFCGVDMRKEFGLILEEPFDDGTQPELRERKLVVPMRDGAYDYGAKWYEERTVLVKCASIQLLTRNDVRRLALALSAKGELRSWYEPEKYYIGRMYEGAQIERIVGAAKRFQLEFICEPFAYGEQITETFTGQKEMTYAGSARTPTHIIITNRGSTAVNGLTVTMKERI